ncbi:PREDICTED: alpha-N-acetylgalactosaminide alpha-2,6-sialyltransferase 5-like [Cyprinodon variegatus]|uniref:Alpha-N-acetylgalactosaminide alpha-2,6-sialyltransferase 6 n=1 Tax=Cyprinodon variegatus TaxID=28743 RepID=A0A3Q2DR91_CYPVA|nr:PREDICTED: alpha-N-acetylgalactosaminide alpha-2,6-sialyltransferase 5-like [Cyprinodon variegatus]
MKIRVCQGVGGIIIVTMVTGFMVVYNISCGSSPSSASRSPYSQHVDAAAPATKRPDSVQASTLDGFAGVMDFKPLRMHCSTCALVTSSGHLTDSNRGKEIDRSECVIRMNDAPCAGHHLDVGRRTSLRVVAHSSLQRVLRRRQELLNGSQETIFIFWGPSSCMRRDGRGHVYNNLRLLKHLLPKLKVYTISRTKMLKFDELFNKETGIDRKRSNSWLSTGWFTMAIALELCDRIKVFGMVPPDFCRSSSHPMVPYHYYEPSGPDECSMYLLHEGSRIGSHHRFITEKTVFSNWARTLNIQFYQPDWKPSALVPNMNSSHFFSPEGS